MLTINETRRPVSCNERSRVTPESREAPGRFQTEVTQTIGAHAADLFHAWVTSGRRESWLPGVALRFRRAAPIRHLCAVMDEGDSEISVSFVPRGLYKSLVTICHSGLESPQVSEQMHDFWSQALQRLAIHCLSRKPASGLPAGAFRLASRM